MRQPGIKYRWVLSPMEFLSGDTKRPICAAYSHSYHMPMELVGNIGLAHCTMFASQLAAAQQDPRLLVLDSIHSNQPIPAVLVAQLASYGITTDMTVHDLLVSMSAFHLDFLPEN